VNLDQTATDIKKEPYGSYTTNNNTTYISDQKKTKKSKKEKKNIKIIHTGLGP
jgi:hypothetical protein